MAQFTKRPVIAGSLIGLAVMLSACGGGDGVEVPAGYEDLEQCSLRSISVDDMPAAGALGCDLVGSTIALPGGATRSVGGVGSVDSFSSSSTESYTYTIVNWGIPGVGVYSADGDRLAGIWGTSDDAESLQRQQAEVDGFDSLPE
ncbi:hypothetical protein [Microbacterium sp. NPDC055683]